MLTALLPMLKGHPKVKGVIEQMFGQPVDHVAGCFGNFLENVKKGPGLVNTREQQLALFNRIFQGGQALGFSDWESELAAAKIAGYSDMDICISFRERHKWPQTTVENIQTLAKERMPVFIEKAKAAGLLPPDMFPDSGMPKVEITTSGGAAPWENLVRPGTDGTMVNNNVPNNGGVL